MTHTTWQSAVKIIQRKISSPSAQEQALASQLGVNVPMDLPRVVTVALIQDAVAIRFGMPLSPASDSKSEFAMSLAHEASMSLPESMSTTECGAWINFFYLKRRLDSLRDLRLSRGDVVVRQSARPEDCDEVASIGDDGRVYFTGGRAGAWPDQLSVVAREGEQSDAADTAHRIARNRASDRSSTLTWSEQKARSLSEYEPKRAVSEEDVAALRDVIDDATSEKPIQEFLQRHLHLLAGLLRGHARYCIPKPSLGGKYEADFFLAKVDSSGVHYTLVELETPTSSVTLKTSNQLDQHARNGVSQIQEWRWWIRDHLDFARRPNEEQGLGFPDISPESEGLVLIGRRDNLRANAKQVRRRIGEEQRIQVHTYDWLVEQLAGKWH